MTIEFDVVREEYINGAVELVTKAYYEEKKHIQYLPDEVYFKKTEKE